MKKVIIYGLGYQFENNKNKLPKYFDIVGYCDKDIKKVKKFNNGIEIENLSKYVNEVDFIIVTPIGYKNIFNELVSKYNIPKEKLIEFSNFFYPKNGKIPKSKFYGQHYEDAIIMALFAVIGIKIKDIHYLELGVYHPYILSNTYSLYRNGASGYLVDANSEIKELCELYRPRDSFINIAVGTCDKAWVKFYLSTLSACNSLSKEWMQSIGIESQNVREIKVPVKSIMTLLNEIPYKIDLISIDIEGKDDEVIQSIDFNVYRPAIIVIETSSEETIEYLEKNKYIWYSWFDKNNAGGGNSIFIDKKYENRLVEAGLINNC